MFEIPPSTLRYWEEEFTILKPKRNRIGTRYYTNKDIRNLKLIHHLLKERGLTIKGAKKKIRENKDDVGANAEIIEKLQNIRNQLVRIRDEM